MKVYGKQDPAMLALRSAMEARLPAMLVGDPGVGKTATVRALANELGYDLITLLGSSMDPTDIVGLPAPSTMESDEGNVAITAYLAPWWAAKILRDKKVILFLDEFSNAPPAVQASQLTLLQNAELGDGTKLPKETILIGAMNPTSSAVNPTELALPTANRLIFLPWKPSMESWFEGMLDDWGQQVSPKESRWRKRIVEFLKQHPYLLHKLPDPKINVEAYGVRSSDEVNTEIARLAWPSRRSWDNLAQVLGKTPDSPYLQDLIAQGTIGWEAAQEFRAWLNTNAEEGVSPQEVLANPAAVDWSNMGLNESAMLFRSLIEMVSPKTAAPILKAVNAVIVSGNAGLVAPYYQELFKKVTDPKVVGDDVAQRALRAVQQLLSKLTPFLNA